MTVRAAAITAATPFCWCFFISFLLRPFSVKRYLAQYAFHATNRQGTTSPITIQGRPPMWRADKKAEQGEGC